MTDGFFREIGEYWTKRLAWHGNGLYSGEGIQGVQDDFYTMVSMSIEAGRLALLRLLDNATQDFIEIALEGNGSERYTISVSSENGGRPRRLTETDLQTYGRFLPAHVASTVAESRVGGWLLNQVVSRFRR